MTWHSSTMLDLTIGELQALADYHRFEGSVYSDCIRSEERNPEYTNPEQMDSYRTMQEHHRERGRQIKELMAQEEQDQTRYEEDGTVVMREPVWLEEVIMTLTGYKVDEDSDGVTKLACSVAIRLLEEHYEEQE